MVDICCIGIPVVCSNQKGYKCVCVFCFVLLVECYPYADSLFYSKAEVKHYSRTKLRELETSVLTVEAKK